MLEYSLDDAEDLLKKNKVSAEKNILQINFDLGYLRDQMTITEVTMARLYNWDVKRRKDKKAAESKSKKMIKQFVMLDAYDISHLKQNSTTTINNNN